MTKEELDKLPEVEKVVLWQPDEKVDEFFVDGTNITWHVGYHKGVLCKRKVKLFRRIIK